jgi:hypothetical protein
MMMMMMYEHVPKSVERSKLGKVTILWNQQVQTDRTISNNKPDIIIQDNEKGTCMICFRYISVNTLHKGDNVIIIIIIIIIALILNTFCVLCLSLWYQN